MNALETVKKQILEKWENTGVQRVLNFAFYNLLDMITVYPVEDENKYTNKKGNVLPDAYLLKNRGELMQKAYEPNLSGMAAIIGIDCLKAENIISDNKLNVQIKDEEE